jgi:hypothetical protein
VLQSFLGLFRVHLIIPHPRAEAVFKLCIPLGVPPLVTREEAKPGREEEARKNRGGKSREGQRKRETQKWTSLLSVIVPLCSPDILFRVLVITVKIHRSEMHFYQWRLLRGGRLIIMAGKELMDGSCV